MSESNGYARRASLKGRERRKKDIEVDGLKFKAVAWSSKDRSDWVSRNDKERDTINERAIVLSIVDPDTGGMMFSDEDIPELREWDSALVLNLAEQCVLHAGSGVETKKNSNETTSADSPTS